MTLDRRLGEVAEGQDGVVDLRQGRDLGLTPRGLRHRTTSGRLVAVQPGVYRLAGAPVTWAQRLQAACLSADAVASHRAAAHLWDLHDEPEGDLDVTVVRRRQPRPRGVALHRSGDLRAEHVTVRAGIPVTNPLRTIVDLGAVARPWIVEDALDRGLAARLLTIAGAEWMLGELACRGRAGVGVLRRILDERALGADPPDGLLEPRMARLLRSEGLPKASFQHPVRAPGGRLVARVDFAYPDRRLAIEVDGYAWHHTPDHMRNDFARQNALAAEGWTVLRFGWADVVRAPTRVATAIRAVLGP